MIEQMAMLAARRLVLFLSSRCPKQLLTVTPFELSSEAVVRTRMARRLALPCRVEKRKPILSRPRILPRASPWQKRLTSKHTERARKSEYALQVSEVSIIKEGS